MDTYTHLYVDKSSQTFADTLVAFGLANIVSRLLEEQSGSGYSVEINDQGSYYRLDCSPALERAVVLNRTEPLMPIQVIATDKNVDRLPAGIPQVSYEEQREKNTLYWEQRKNKVPDAEISVRPHRHWDIFRAINPGALSGYNNMVIHWWHVREAHGVILALLLDMFASTPNDLAGAVATWKKLSKERGWGISAEMTCLQLYNPDQGKGQNKVKANGLSINNLKAFWLLEWLKAIGFYEAGITRTVRGAKDRKTFVVTPRAITFSINREVMHKFSQTMSTETSTKFDILAVIRYVQALLAYFQQESGLAARLLKQRSIKKRVVAGFHTAFYKDLGNSTATMNLSFIALPGWVEITDPEDITHYRNVLDDLDKLVRQFDESHSDAFTLLQYLRDFVSGDSLDAFFRFTNAFPAYYMGMRERGKYAYPLSTTFIEELIMSTEKKLTPILQSKGFQNIAYAIRQSTVTAQYRKQQGDRKYDVRYGLGQELARQARYPDKFVAALADFLQKYNAENAQVMETRPGPYRKSIVMTDIDEIVALIDEYGSEVVANLLIAYGYARVPREDDQPEESEETTQEMTQ